MADFQNCDVDTTRDHESFYAARSSIDERTTSGNTNDAINKKYERERKLTFKMHILLEDNSRAVALTVG
jgi:hypothetical protein